MLRKALGVVLLGLASLAQGAGVPEVGKPVPDFTLSDHNGQEFTLSSNKAKLWTVLYFYPAADTPGCTKQACAFRDSIKSITDQKAEVYGISTNKVADLKKFQEKYKLNFRLLSDEKVVVTELYGAKMPVLSVAKRWTFIIDDAMTLRYIDQDVDPAMDAAKVATKIKELKASSQEPQKS